MVLAVSVLVLLVLVAWAHLPPLLSTMGALFHKHTFSHALLRGHCFHFLAASAPTLPFTHTAARATVVVVVVVLVPLMTDPIGLTADLFLSSFVQYSTALSVCTHCAVHLLQLLLLLLLVVVVILYASALSLSSILRRLVCVPCDCRRRRRI